MTLSTYMTGLTMGLSLIVAIGAQNAFVLKQGLLRQHVFVICLICALSDAVLILLGVTSMGKIAAIMPWLDPVMRYGGAAFLIVYGARNLLSAVRSDSALVLDGAGGGMDAWGYAFASSAAICLAGAAVVAWLVRDFRQA